MNNCKKCGSEFEPQKGLKSYCSMSCRNSRTWTKEDKKKKSKSAKSSDLVKKSIEKAHKVNLDPELMKVIAEKRKNTFKRKILEADFESLSFERLRKRVILEQHESCNHCKNKEWMGKQIPLELEHIDGDNTNNKRENLEALCPNCHALTDTWRGRNKKRSNSSKISDEEMLSILIENKFNFRQSLLQVGLAAKGGNYKRCHKLKREYDEINNS